MIKNTFLILIFIALFPVVLFAQYHDSSAVISSATTQIEFVWNSKLGRVEVKQNEELNYIADAYDVTVRVAEFYDDNSTIDALSLRVNGKVPYDFKPVYSYYSREDIFYSDAHICYFPVYLKEKGFKATVNFRKTITDPRYFTSIYFSEPYKIKERKIILKVPRWMKVDFKEFNFGKYTISKSVLYDKGEDADITTYIVKGLPAEKYEPYSPGPSYLYPHLLVLSRSSIAKGQPVTYFNSTADQYRWYSSLTKSVVNDKPVLKAKAEEITKDCKDDFQKIKAVFYWVQKNIRYIAFEDGIAGFKPEKADEVLRKMYGDCKGMAHLTQSLLKELGFDARLCWIGTNHIAYNYELPSMAVDNHMICALNYKGKTYFLDATETYLPFNEYAERIQGRQVLIEDGEGYILGHIPITDVSQNLDYEKRQLSITGGVLSGSATYLAKGEEKEFLLNKIKGTRKNDVENALNRYLRYEANNVVQKVVTSDLDDFDADLKISYEIQQRSGFSTFGKEFYVEMDLRKDLKELTLDTIERRHDYWFPYKYNIERETELMVPENYSIGSVPANLQIRNTDYDFDIQYTVTADKVICRKKIAIRNPRISKASFGSWNIDIKKLNEAYNETVTLKAK